MPTSPTPSIAPSVSQRSIIVAALSTVVEWYDFTLYLYFATVLSRVFFQEVQESLLAVLAGFAVSYLLRPLGAVVFGHIGDRYGRKLMLMGSMVLMTLAMFATALLPTAWAYAGLLMIALRCVMAFSVGAEYTGVVAYLLEGAGGQRRGFITSLASASSEIGALLAVLVCSITVQMFSEEQLLSVGWRIPFVLGGVLALVILLLRHNMEESPVFLAAQAKQNLSKSPLLDTLKTQRRAIVNSFVISALGSITYYVGIVYVPTFLTKTAKLSEQLALWLSTLAAVVVIVVTPLVGLLSDKIGRKPVLTTLALVNIALPLLLFYLMSRPETGTALLGAVLMACIAGAVSAIGAVTTAEQFTTAGRLSGLALGTTMATAIFGGLTPLVAHALLTYSGWYGVPAVMIMLVALFALPVFLRLKETAFDGVR